MAQPSIRPRSREKATCIHLPKREELLLYTVRAFPNASSSRPESSARSATSPDEPKRARGPHAQLRRLGLAGARLARHEDRPPPLSTSPWYAATATLRMCGLSSSSSRFSRSLMASGAQHATGLYGLSATSTGPIAV